MPELFSTTAAVVDRSREIFVTGELDVYTSPRLRERLHETIRPEATKVIINLSGLTFIDSTGLGVLAGALKRAQRMQVDLTLSEVPPSAVKVLELTGMTRVFSINC